MPPRAARPAWSCDALPDDVPANVPLVLVEDTTRALGRLAAFHRARFTIPVVAVTGSNGKTTTKELVAGVLATRWEVLKPERSFNNQWGLAAHPAASGARASGRGAGDRHQRPRRDRRAGRAGHADGGDRDDRRGRAHGVPRLARGRARGEGRPRACAAARRRGRAERRRRARGRHGARHAGARGDLRSRRLRPRAGGRRGDRRRGRPALHAGGRRRAAGRDAGAGRPSQRDQRAGRGGRRRGAGTSAGRDRAPVWAAPAAGGRPLRVAPGRRDHDPRRHVQRQPGVGAGRARHGRRAPAGPPGRDRAGRHARAGRTSATRRTARWAGWWPRCPRDELIGLGRATQVAVEAAREAGHDRGAPLRRRSRTRWPTCSSGWRRATSCW